jgi:hypothetical protein
VDSTRAAWSRAAISAGVLGAVSVVIALAHMFGLLGESPVGAAAALLAPIAGAVGLALALVARWRERSVLATIAIQVGAVVSIVSVCLLVLALI